MRYERRVEASREFVLCHVASGSSLPYIFALKAVAATNDTVSVELPGVAWSRRHSRDGSTRLRAPASRDRSGFTHHDREEDAIFKLRHYQRTLLPAKTYFPNQRVRDCKVGVYSLAGGLW